MAMQKWTLALTVYGLSNSHFFVPFIAKNGDAEVDVGFYSVVHPIAASLSLSLPRMAMQKLTLALTVYGLSNSRFFVPFIAKNGDAEVDVGFCSVVHPIAACLTLSLPRMAMQKWTLAFTKWMLAFTVCGSSNSNFFVAFIAKNGDAEVGIGFNSSVVHPIAASLSLSLPRMAMQKWTLAFTVCGSSNSGLFDPFIAKNGNAEVDIGFYTNSLSLSLPRMAMQKLTLALTVYGLSNSRFLSLSLPRMTMQKWTLAFAVCSSSNSRLFDPFIAKNGNAEVDVGFYTSLSLSLPRMAMQKLTLALTVYGLSNSRFLSLSLPRMTMQKWTLAFAVCGSSNSRLFDPFIAKNDNAEVDVGFYSMWVLQ
ncbi:hypothetical protein K7X08_002684 [Anisodus acutangulus]|uniref:Uncharacterized protein n=1 Tax=Anisodus acutangulus TaxID=402998 RepID=A0A9Q1L0V1_9SOLA|nr:hypothetical protein K7X08_002684 [Anisodus acutangulus]